MKLRRLIDHDQLQYEDLIFRLYPVDLKSTSGMHAYWQDDEKERFYIVLYGITELFLADNFYRFERKAAFLFEKMKNS